MTEDEIRATAFVSPLGGHTYPRPPFRFKNREFLIITYRTDPEALRRVVPAPLVPREPVVKYEFIKMPDSSGLGDYMETGQVIPVMLDGRPGNYTHRMFLDNAPAVFSGRELFGFPKVFGKPKLKVRSDTLVGTLDISGVRVATATMGFKHHPVPVEPIEKSLSQPSYLVKIIPNADGSNRVLELVNCKIGNVSVKEAWSGPSSLELHPHWLSDMNQLPILEILDTVHLVADLTIESAETVHNYLDQNS